MLDNIILIVSASIAIAVIIFTVTYLLVKRYKRKPRAIKNGDNRNLKESNLSEDELKEKTKKTQQKPIIGQGGWLLWIQLRLIILGLFIAGTSYLLQGTPLYFGLLSIISHIICLLLFYNLNTLS